MLNDDRIMPVKRHFDEIDRFSLNRQPQQYKRNFDEIDRLVPQAFAQNNKREEIYSDLNRNDKYGKYI